MPGLFIAMLVLLCAAAGANQKQGAVFSTHRFAAKWISWLWLTFNPPDSDQNPHPTLEAALRGVVATEVQENLRKYLLYDFHPNNFRTGTFLQLRRPERSPAPR